MSLVPSLQAGSQFGPCKFSQDSKFLFSCCGSQIKVFNTLNGECVHDLQGHSKLVTGVLLNPSNVLQLISCGTDGLLIYWDYLDGVILKKHDLHLPLYGILAVNAEKKSILMLAQLSEHKQTFGVMLWKKKKDMSTFEKPKTLLEDCEPDLNLVSYGCMKDCVAAARKNKLGIHSMKTGKTKYVCDRDKFNKDKAVTSVACHPTESCVAAGLENGRILLWYNFFKDGVPATSNLHWHSLAVTCLSFTPDGSCLLSGGHECVMVRWQMGSQNNRDFKPRMGAPLQRIQSSPDGTLYAINNADNVVQLLDINLKVLLVYRGLTRCCFNKNSAQDPIPCGLVYDPRSRTLVTNGLPGHLQFYSLALSKQLFNLDIVGQNYISPENLDRPTVITEVTCAAVSHDGQWIATFETWDDGVFSPEMRLKFWAYSTEAQTYSLNTRVEHPHEKKVTSLMFRPSPPSGSGLEYSPTLLTLGDDNCFKIWALVDDTDIYRENMRWNCDAVGFYRGLSGHSADFSTDGSTLAVGFKHLLTIWDPDNNVVRTTLSNGLTPKEDIRCIKFGDYKCRHQLVVATSNHLVSWDLLSLTVMWTIQSQASVLTRDPASDLMAFISGDKLFIFRPSSSAMVYEQEKVSSSKVLSAIFVPDGRSKAKTRDGWPSQSQLYLYNADQQLVMLDTPEQHVDDSSKKVKIAKNLPQSALSSFLAESVTRETKEVQTKDTMGRTTAAQDKFFSSLLQSNEPVSHFCDKYLNDLLVKRKQKKRSALPDRTRDSDEDAESSSSSESEEETSEPPVKYTKTEDGSQGPSKKENMDKLLSKSLDWVQWCSSLSLK